MNFFEYQEQARRQSRWLVFLFVLAVLIIVVVIDFAILVAFGVMDPEQQQSLFSLNTVKTNAVTLGWGALATAAVIIIASLFKTAALRSGGGKVARDLGAVDNGYRVLSNIGRHAHQEVAHLHVHIFAGGDLGPMIRRPKD